MKLEDNQGRTKELKKLLKKAENMSIEEYNDLYIRSIIHSQLCKLKMIFPTLGVSIKKHEDYPGGYSVTIDSLEIWNDTNFQEMLFDFLNEYFKNGYLDIHWGVYE